MPHVVPCPTCSSPNKPGAARCHTCGRNLHPAGAAPEAPPLVLQRVTSGEVFTARIGNTGLRTATAPPPAAPAVDDVPVALSEARPVEDHSDVIAAAMDRIRANAQGEGHRFKPYVPAKTRKDPTHQAKQEVGEQLDAAVALLRERRFEDAIAPLLKAIARDDEDRRPWILLAEAYLRIGRPYKAAVGYLRALELSPKDEQAWIGLGRVLRSLGDLTTAAAVLDRATAIHPTHPDTWVERGLTFESLENFPEAARSFAKVLELRPDHRLALTKRQELETRLAPHPVSLEETQGGLSAASTSAAGLAHASEPEADIFDEMADALAKAATPGGQMSEEPVTVARAGPTSRPERVRTYVEGLDETLEGGIPWGHVVLIEGAPGTMKSSLGFSILLQNAARNGLHCLYLSLEERASSLLKQMGSLGLHLDVAKGSLVVLDPRTASGLLGERTDWVDALEDGIRSIKGQRGLDLVVIDSLEALEVLAKFKDRRREMYRLFEWLRDLDVTSFLITERPDWVVAGHVLQGRWDEDFLADGVLHLRMHLVSDLDAQRRLRIVKMRGTKHETGYLAMVLDDARFRVTRAMSA